MSHQIISIILYYMISYHIVCCWNQLVHVYKCAVYDVYCMTQKIDCLPRATADNVFFVVQHPTFAALQGTQCLLCDKADNV